MEKSSAPSEENIAIASDDASKASAKASKNWHHDASAVMPFLCENVGNGHSFKMMMLLML